MLHVFAVNSARLLTFDISMAMDKVINLKAAVEQESQVSTSQQVLLMKDGLSLNDASKVCSYAAGTDSNPFFMFDTSVMNSAAPSCNSPVMAEDFSDDIRSALTFPPSYSTVLKRTQLALHIKEATSGHVDLLRALLRDQKFMFEGWQAAFANLDRVIKSFNHRIVASQKQCAAVYQHIANQRHLLEDFHDDIELLRQIPLLASLVSSDEALSSGGASLLDWIEGRCHGAKLLEMMQGCKQQESLLTENKFSDLISECSKSRDSAQDATIRDDARYRTVIAEQEKRLIAVARHLNDQIGLAQGFVRNRETARHLHEGSLSHDAMITLCESHVSQLRKMQEIEATARKAVLDFHRQKASLMHKFHNSLKWLYNVQARMANSNTGLEMFVDRLGEFQQKHQFLAATKRAPELYFMLLTECARRRTFAQSFTRWSDGVLTTTCVAREREMEKRRKLKTEVGSHFIMKLFPGFSDKPPAVSKRPSRKFDVDIPVVTQEDISCITKAAPQLLTFQRELETVSFPWQLVYSTSMKTTLTMQRSGTGSSYSKPEDGDSEQYTFPPISPPTSIVPLPVYSQSSSEEEVYHSILDDVSSDIVKRLKEMEREAVVKDEEMRKLCRKYKEELEREQSRAARELAASARQLENEKEQRKDACKRADDLKAKLKAAEAGGCSDEAARLRTEVALKNQEISDLRSEVLKLNNTFAMRGADLEQRNEQEKWAMQSNFDEDRKNFLTTISALERNVRDRTAELGAAEERIQELERELSDAESLNATLKVTMETCSAEVEICQSDVAAHKTKAEDAQNLAKKSEARAVSAETDVRKTNEKLAGLRAILADYEVELEEAKNAKRDLKSERNQAQSLGEELAKMKGMVGKCEEELCREKVRVAELTGALEAASSELAQNEESVKRLMDEQRELNDAAMLQVKQEAEEKLQQVFEINKKKINDLEGARDAELERLTEAHKAEVQRMKEEQRWGEEEMKKQHSFALDELQADHLDDVCRLQAEIEELQGRLGQEQQQKQIDDVTLSLRLPAREITSHALNFESMTSSNGESTSKIARFDDVMVASLKEELEKEKEVIKSTLKKREEVATKRRQVVFNSAIQRLSSAKDAEIQRLKQQMMTSSVALATPDSASVASSARIKDRDKIVAANFQPDDVALVVYEPKYCHHVLFTTGRTLYFLHNDSISELKLKADDRTPVIVRVDEKQYCQARKETNRFRVSVGTKFYRVKVSLLSKDLLV